MSEQAEVGNALELDPADDWGERVFQWTYRHLGEYIDGDVEIWRYTFSRRPGNWVRLTWVVTEYRKRYPDDDLHQVAHQAQDCVAQLFNLGVSNRKLMEALVEKQPPEALFDPDHPMFDE